MKRLLGLDTEYGLLIEGADVRDLVDEARALVQCWPGAWAGPWDYSGEQPLQDLRGFTADHLNEDPQDAQYDRPPARPMARSEERSDRVLQNGARLYQDHGHPEYASPECRSLFDLIAHDKAGERVVWQCAQAYEQKTGRRVSLYKNNVDFHGSSYGAHENYLLRRDVPFEQLQAVLLPFLVTRILYAGAGKVGVEGTLHKTATYQLSQRADFFTEVCSVDTLHRRPILNTRDEPHAPERGFRRLHVICGDANLCEFAGALKVGATALVLDLLEQGWTVDFALVDPVEALKALSRNLHAPLALNGGKTCSGFEIQRRYWTAAREHYVGRDAETDWVLSQWGSVLEALEENPARLKDRLDWVAKRELLSEFLRAEDLSWTKADPEMLQSLDLAYHDLDPESGLFMGLQEQGHVQRLVNEAAVVAAMEAGPKDTRAFARGWCVRHLREQIVALNWSRIVFEHQGQQVMFSMQDAVDERAQALNELVQQPGAVLEALVQKAQSGERL